ncbi:hypothetical protein PHMEG_00012762 [Phytophthora megakarya]|uniref:Uncharacterized protein n=1 Tax=Phytophthora megakarya TaxID=4795 RepID=A0A225W9F8_9STRA|nr:hypothetical protein PHMEG_00012762 [Phytophthora megakarya]
MTTIGRYIARFRYEKPQPRETRVAAQQSEFWWTKSPRYSRSPSPPSTWASGGVFSFSDDELLSGTEEEEIKHEEDDSVESKLRWRLSHSVNSKQGIRDETDELLQLKASIPEISQSEDWSSVDLEEEDPEEVIERVRKRLGWSTETSSSSQLKPVEFRLVINSDSDTGSGYRGTKPPLSPGWYRREEALGTFGSRSSSSWSEREQLEMVSPIVNACVKDALIWVEPGGANEAVRHGKLLGIGETKSVNGKLSPTEFPTMQSSTSSVDSHCSEGSQSNQGANGEPVNTGVKETDIVDISENKGDVEDKEYKVQSQCKTPKCDAGDEVPELPLLPTVSLVRTGLDQDLSSPSSNENLSLNGYKLPDKGAEDQLPKLQLLPLSSPSRPYSTSSKDNLSGRSHDSSLFSPGKEEFFSSEEAKTIDSIFNSMLHHWENNFLSFTEYGIEQEDVLPAKGKYEHETESKEVSNDYTNPAPIEATSPNENISTVVNNFVNNFGEDEVISSGTQNSTTSICTESATLETKLSEIAYIRDEFTHSTSDSEEKQYCEEPGEDTDEMIQMLLGRIVLLEEALCQIDS